MQEWAQRVRDGGKTVETKVFENGGHVVTNDPETTDAATAAVVDFLRRTLG
jgi:hypothetical protein